MSDDTFHVIPLPVDQWGNTAYTRAVIEVYRDGTSGDLIAVAPEHYATHWAGQRLLADFWPFAQVDGPARLLDDTEYDALLAQIRPGR